MIRPAMAGSRARGGGLRHPRARFCGAPAAGILLLLSSAILLSSCGTRKARRDDLPQPIGGEQELRALLDGAERRADPQGAVLAVLWSIDEPPSRGVEELGKRWIRYGLIPIGICLDLLGTGEERDRGDPAASSTSQPTRERALGRIREWEKSHRDGIRGLIYDGGPDYLRSRLGVRTAGPAIVLLSAQGAVLWSGTGFGGLEDLERVLNIHLGEPPVA